MMPVDRSTTAPTRAHHSGGWLQPLALALALALGVGCTTSPRPAAEPPTAEPGAAVAWEELDVAGLQQAMRDGRIDAEGLARHFLERIARIDDDGPRLNAVIEINPDALEIARQRDLERTQGRERGPLHGIPVMLKDNIDTDDAMATSAGSLALANHHPGRDAELVRRLRDAGAVLLGKTNLSEWANFRSTRSTSGWSARGGQTRNPHALDRNPCGSSSGSAAAVAAGLVPLAVGTETDGSIVCPAAANGVVGLKPGIGRVSRFGIIPISESQDTAGSFARSVRDAELLLAAISGPDPRDPSTAGVERFRARDSASAGEGLRGARIGVLRRHFGAHPDADRAYEEALAAMEAAGATLVDPVELPSHGSFSEDELEVLLHEFHEGIDRYLAETRAPVADLEGLIAFNLEHADRELRWFGQDLFEMAARRGPLDDPAYLKARDRARRLGGTDGIDAAIAEHRLDALVAPTTGPAWMTDLVNGDHYPGGSSSAAAVAGYPIVSVPAGQVHGLPIGLSFIAGRGSEAKLVELAAGFERAHPALRTPRLIPGIQP